MQVWSRERWSCFVVWLDSGISGIHPRTLRLTLGPVAALLPLARQVAGSLNGWLLALLAERARRGLALRPGAQDLPEAEALAEDCCQQPYRRQEAERSAAWMRWLLEAELLRLARLAEAPEEALRRPDWLAWEVRYWALAVSLARLGQLYAALARREGRAAATEMLYEALARAWSRATAASPAA